MELSKLQALFKWSFVYVYVCLIFMALCGNLEAQIWFIIMNLLGVMAENAEIETEA